ncbi:hypothetical protein EDD15DRAFT_2299353 [Pisolithus albus]|nr:hypothetical protein EDD15DRAFT_2299353 [Pisolithus albus]
MATFEYVDIPPEAIRLVSSPQEGNSVRPAHKIPTTFPDPSTASGFFSWHLHVDNASSENGSATSGPSKIALSIFPQLLLSSSLPAAAASAAANASSSTGLSLFATSSRSGQPSQTFLSTRDPLSLPIVTNNFRRFVAKVGPVFWLQDRIEEIILWKKGWKRTVVWLFAYGFICYFPGLILLLPHALLLSVMLAYHPAPGSPPVPLSVSEGTADWQANIQAIQNLMGAFSDAHDAILPLLPFLCPARLPPVASTASSTSHSSEAEAILTLNSSLEQKTDGPRQQSTTHTSSYSPHPTLTLTVISFLILLPVVTADILPLRLLFFLLGAGTVCALHPNVRSALTGVWVARHALLSSNVLFSISLPLPILHRPHLPFHFHFIDSRTSRTLSKEVLAYPGHPEESSCSATPMAGTDVHRRVVGERAMGTDEWGNPEWRNVKSKSTILFAGTWSKTHLRQSERAPWTRGRDGWSGVGGEISNLTFSLTPGWAFVETESWRADLEGSWALEGQHPDNKYFYVETQRVCADEDGWVYTSDTWSNPQPHPCPAEGWVTRRRRWTRRVYWKGL